jgi:hypothetical protein
MIKKVVPPLTSGSVMDDGLVSAPSLDQTPLTPATSRGLSNLEVTESPTIPAVERLEDIREQSRLDVPLPGYLLEEVSWVAEAEHCEIAEIVVNALDQYLADHWVRKRD